MYSISQLPNGLHFVPFIRMYVHKSWVIVQKDAFLYVLQYDRP